MLNEIDFYADALSERIENLLRERNILRRELSRKTDGTLERDKEFVRLYQENIINNALYDDSITRLEHILLIK
ncbi:MAG: hypothetical protein IJP48_05380 [Synergistaceae bacterium]|nr:hypothetical protein [Synergistaceae bacterium]